MLDREGTRGILDHSGTTSLAWQWLEMETGEHGSAHPDHAESRHVRSAFPQPINEALTTITDARIRLIRDSDYLGSAVLLDDLVTADSQVQHWSTIRSLWTITRIETYVESGEFSRALDLTLEELAAQIGCAAVTIRHIETDERRPSKQLAARLAFR